MSNLITRDEALQKGLSRYFTGKPCTRGHLSERYANSYNCIECAEEDHRRWRTKHKDRLAKWRWKRLGYPEPTRPKPETCECCGKKDQNLHLDHCHDTNEFRGWLCGSCNRGIGLLGDDVDALKRAINYLLRRFR